MRLIFLFLLLASFVCHSQADESSYKKLNKAIQKGKTKKAKKILLEISAAESNTFLELLKIAQFYSEIEELDSAAIYIEYAIDYHKNMPMDYADENFKRAKDSLFKQSILIYDKIIEITPNELHYCHRGVLKKDIGMLEEALLDLNASIKIDSLDYISYYNRGLLYGDINQLDSAIIDYLKCIKLNPAYGAAYLNLGYTFLEQDKFELAINEFTLAFQILINPIEKSYVLNNIGFCYYKLNDFILAKEFIYGSLNINPINSFAYKNLALINIEQGDKVAGCENIEKSIELGFVHQYGNEILLLKKDHCE